MRMNLKTRKRVLSVLAAVAFVLSLAATPAGLDTYYTVPDDPVVLSFEKHRGGGFNHV